ncbi:MAG TPA: MFS transporter [Xanthobacteraceae bacterium]|nr:MFS transporter [Xanthobacteraceae bacterium]
MRVPAAPSIESKQSWIVATAALVVLTLSFGAPWIVVVALKPIAAELDGTRSIPALASALAWFGQGLGGILMGRLAEIIGVRWTVVCGAVMICLGLLLSMGGAPWQLYVGHGLFIGILGNGGINAPFYVYVSRWFDRRRGSALALISSGTFFAGSIWPNVFEPAIAALGWRQTMLWYGLFELVVIVPIALTFLKSPPEQPAVALAGAASAPQRVFGWPPRVVYILLAAAGFLCCVTMSMPQVHLVAFCSDIGIKPAHGAAMLSLLLGAGFISRQIWGAISDRIGGLRTLLLSSASQAVAMSGFLLTQDEVGLFIVSAAFGLGFAGLVPAYVLAIRQHFPASEASWRIPVLLLLNGTGMGTGGWLAGVLYDYFGYYAPAFAAGILANLLNLGVIAVLVIRMKVFNLRTGAQ